MTDPVKILRQLRDLVKVRQPTTALLPIVSCRALEAWCAEHEPSVPPKVLPAIRTVWAAMSLRSLTDVHTSHVDALLKYLAPKGKAA